MIYGKDQLTGNIRNGYLLQIEEKDTGPKVELKHSQMILRIRPATSYETRRAILEAWYRENLKEAIPALIAKWEPLMGVKVERFFVQRMKTKWGSCSPGSRSLRLNTELARKPPECLEYIVVHEMVHLLEPTHNARFISLMDQFMPKWRFYKDELNRLPVRHENWAY
jgi:predicted metal-dependent hydrolase